jgi:hypothetical protein
MAGVPAEAMRVITLSEQIENRPAISKIDETAHQEWVDGKEITCVVLLGQFISDADG